MPRKRQDLTGKKFGRLTAIKRSAQQPTKWECVCDCGNSILVNTGNLNFGTTTSCGCSRNKSNEDFTGKKFGNWTAISKNTERKRSAWFLQCICGKIKSFSSARLRKNDVTHCKYCEMIEKQYNRLTPLKIDQSMQANMICKCDCGSIKSIGIGSILSGKVKSCGCIRKETTLDITLKQFGKLTAIKQDAVLTRRWICECACGNLLTVPKQQLIRNQTTDCGCEKALKQNLTGKKFGRLIAISFVKTKQSGRVWKCYCGCGKWTEKTVSYLYNHRTQSCGCMNIHKRYPRVPETLKRVYINMQQRCYNKNLPIYKWYGGKGVTICNEWLNNKGAFYKWALLHGYSNELEIDRKNGNGIYEPGNCRFITKIKNLQNRPSKYNV